MTDYERVNKVFNKLITFSIVLFLNSEHSDKFINFTMMCVITF